MNQDHCLVEQFEMIFRAHFSSVKFFINRFSGFRILSALQRRSDMI